MDAELLAAHVLGVPRTRLAATAEFRPDQAATYRELVAARARRVPLQHLTGTAPFRHLVLAVGPGVFIPRPETELLVDWALTVITPGAIVVDLCAGSGAIALSVAREAQPMRVYAVERDPAALRWLRHNAGDSPVVSWAGSAPTEGPGALASAVQVIEGDVAEPTLLSTLDGTVDVVLCNPPYVPAGIRVPPEVAEHDPPEAVFSGADGLDVIRAVIPLAARLLRPGGWVGIEHDESQAVGVPLLLDASGHFRDVRDHPDLAGRPRFATARMADFTA